MCVVQSSFDDQPGFRPGTKGPEIVTPSSLSSERLRKAIERNRAKQMGRSTNANQFEEKLKQNFTRPRSTSTFNSNSANPPPFENNKMAENISTRHAVATVDNNIEFIRPNRSLVKRMPEIGYTFTPTKKLNKKQSLLMAKIGWFFCLFLLFRLVFADRGVIDFNDLKSILNSKMEDIYFIVKENENIIKDIF